MTWKELWVPDCRRGGAGRGDACLHPAQPGTLPVTALGIGFAVCQVLWTCGGNLVLWGGSLVLEW